MNYKEIKADLFDFAISKTALKSSANNERRFPVHCISADYSMSGGIAVPMNSTYDLKNNLKKYYSSAGECIFVNNVFNLITKDKVYERPTYKNFTKSLYECKDICINENIKMLVMPKIGCGIDGLDWSKVSMIIKIVFEDTHVDILVCSLE